MALYKSHPHRLQKQIPQRLTPDQLIKKAAEHVQGFEIQNLMAFFLELYKQHYGYKFFNFGRAADQTALRKIILMCQSKGWPVKDFVEYNVLWYKKNLPYRPLPTNFCGQKAEERYESFLRREGYITNEQPVPTRRREEIESVEATRLRVRVMKEQHALPEQAEEAAVEYADRMAAKVTEPANPPMSWIKYTHNQLVELRKQQVWAAAKEEYLKRWREDVIYGRTTIPKGGQL